MRQMIRRLGRHFLVLLGYIHRTVKELEPWGIVLAVVALLVTLYELDVDRGVREATLFSLATEVFQKSRELDDTANRAAGNSFISATTKMGQIRILEEMVELGISLRAIDASMVNLSQAQLKTADFRYANLRGTYFSGSDLSSTDFGDASLVEANLTGATLAKSDLTRANLSDSFLVCVNFSDAVFSEANLSNATTIGSDFTGADLRSARAITQGQLDDACGINVMLPLGLSIEDCSEAQELDCPQLRKELSLRTK